METPFDVKTTLSEKELAILQKFASYWEEDKEFTADERKFCGK
jgi:hypothetical protein